MVRILSTARARLNGMTSTVSYIWSRQKADSRKNYLCREVASARSHRMVPDWLSIGFFVNFAPGKDTGVAWLMMSGFMILRAKRLKI